MNTAIRSEIQKLAPSAVIELFVLDLSLFSQGSVYFHAGTNSLQQRLTWQGKTYEAFPIQVEGFEFNGNGQIPRPKLKVANVTGAITAMVLIYQDLVGAKITRKRTLAKYLDAVNFPGGVNPTADPTAEFADDIYYIDRKSRETRDVIEFELAASFDLEGVNLPRRQIVQNVCPWRYRSSECGYTGTSYFDANDQFVASSTQDICGKRLSSCQARFGQNAELPFGGFPAAGLFR
jgi:lambda family phage minor tail protein L